ncbi:hypothetical protein [Pseudescherichia vulneris]|uniref:hypothetical protein n=1 Tax=Pseudescherichia vulneris TaxID=566 RepID=UPI0028D5C7E0|nr:hypothetical protein [Pseudescherichia vulneris]
MTDVKIYTITSDDLSPPIKGEGFCTDMVRHSDYAALEERLNQLAAENAAMAAEVQAVRWACGQVYITGYNHGHLNTVDGLPHADEKDLVMRGGEVLYEFTDPDHCGVAVDAILADVRAQGVEMFADSTYCPDENQSGAHEFAAQLRNEVRV